MELSQYADRLRRHDWSACMSDSGAVASRGAQAKARLLEVASLGKNYMRLWDLGSGYHGNFTWSPGPRMSAEERWESGWRWVGAYCWVHGVKLSEAECQVLVAGPDEVSPLFKTRRIAGQPKWAEIDELIKARQEAG